MIYTDDKTIQTIKDKSKKIVRACDFALSLIDNVQGAILQFAGKSITGNKARLTNAIKAVNQDLIVKIDWDNYLGADLCIYYWDATQGGGEQARFYLSWGGWTKDNIIQQDKIIEQFAHGKKNLESQKARAIYTAKNIKTILNKHKKFCDELNKLQHDCSSDLLNIAGIKSTYYM